MKRNLGPSWNRRGQWLLALCLCLPLAGPVVHAQADSSPGAAPTGSAPVTDPLPKRGALVLYSRHDQAPWQAGVLAGLHERLGRAAAGQQPILYEERMDALRLAGPRAQAAF